MSLGVATFRKKMPKNQVKALIDPYFRSMYVFGKLLHNRQIGQDCSKPANVRVADFLLIGIPGPRGAYRYLSAR
jgi:hypothetical protein